MKRRHALLLLPMLVATAGLTGCLFTLNEPVVSADGTLAVFLSQDGSYSLFPDGGVLHLHDGEGWVPVPGATLTEGGGFLDVSPDGREALYADLGAADFFAPIQTTVYRVGLQSDSVPAEVWSTQWAVARAAWVEGDRALVLAFGEEDLAALHSLDLTTGETERLIGGLLSFDVFPKSEEILLLTAEERDPVPVGSVVRWNPSTGARETLASFVLNEGTVELFATLPHSFGWAISPDGEWLALALFDATVFEPEVRSDTPSLYLINLESGVGQRISQGAARPLFSPDGDGLLYIDANDGDEGVLTFWDLESGISWPMSVVEGVSDAFWLSPGRLGLAIEAEDDRFRLIELDPETGVTRMLVDAPNDE